MIEVIKDKQENIKAVCEYYIVDESGNYDAKGKLVWINEVEISKAYRGNGILKEMVKRVLAKVPQETQFGYFWRQSKYPNRKIRIWHRNKWLNFIKEG